VPSLADEAVERMLIQHILTERIFSKLFDNDEFRSRNVVAAEIEKVVAALIKGSFNRTAFLSSLEPFYKAIELSATTTSSYEEKQGFLNNVYERFFQSFSPKEADTHGIVYTPQPIVDFMVRSVEDILKKEFGKSLADRGVHILDPFVGTGNFITRVIREIAAKRKSALAYKYQHELHCNEVMLLPYYIASMNIEHEYLAQIGQYEPFQGICLVDTFELAEPEQQGFSFMTAENTARVKRQKEAPIFVIVGNPPYNMQQVSENDENRNRTYKHMDQRIQQTYARASNAALRNKLSDPYVKAFRFATDRIRDGGLVCFVSNNGFIDQVAFDGMRRYLAEEYSSIYILDLGGNVRTDPKLSGTTHNVFGIQVGVAITLLVKNPGAAKCQIYYCRMHPKWTRQEKYEELDRLSQVAGVEWETIYPDAKHNWLTEREQSDFPGFMPIGDKNAKGLRDVHAAAATTRSPSSTSTMVELQNNSSGEEQRIVPLPFSNQGSV
jgi:predicted helicase